MQCASGVGNPFLLELFQRHMRFRNLVRLCLLLSTPGDAGCLRGFGLSLAWDGLPDRFGTNNFALLRLTTPAAIRQARNTMSFPAPDNWSVPNWQAVLREVVQSLRDFVVMAFPVFVGICLVAGLLQWSGALESLTCLLAPVMAVFNLPPQAALAVVLGSVRKDGLAIGLLGVDADSLKVPLDSPSSAHCRLPGKCAAALYRHGSGGRQRNADEFRHQDDRATSLLRRTLFHRYRLVRRAPHFLNFLNLHSLCKQANANSP